MSGISRHNAARVLPVMVALVGIAPVACGDIIGDVVRVGYLADTGGQETRSVIRVGAWTPVVVDLALLQQTSFDGILRLRQFDRDGDIYVDSVPVHLADTGSGARQRYWLYTVANPQDKREHDYEVELLESESGDESDARLVQVISGSVPVNAMVPPMRPERLTDDACLILEISDTTLGRVRHLQETKYSNRFDREIFIAHASPGDLPGNWIGLEMVDYLIWDNADPTQLTPAQAQALVAWMEQGGRLVVAAGRTSDTLAQSKEFGPLLPVRFERVASTSHLPTVRTRLLGLVEDDAANYGRPIVYAACTALPDSDVKPILYDAGTKSTIVAARRVGRGRLTYVAAALSDLLVEPEADFGRFFERVLELRMTPVGDETANMTYINLFRFLDREVGFYESGAARLALVLLFAVAYVLLATLAAWKVLQARNQLKQSWTALAVVAVLATVVSLISVQMVHGVGRDLRQLTIVDGVSDQVAAQATAYFGVKTATHSRLDLWLPGDYRLQTEPAATACMLRPMLDSRDWLEKTAGFTDPTRYWLRPSTAEVHDVPLRATLKQFEGRWQGELRGTVRSSVAAAEVAIPDSSDPAKNRKVYGVSADSWIENGLDANLYNCQLIITEHEAMAPQSFLSISQRSRDAFHMQVFALGELKAGERVNLYQRIFLDGGKAISSERYDRQGLNVVQRGWGDAFITLAEFPGMQEEKSLDYRLEHYEFALLLASVITDIDPNGFGVSAYAGLRFFSRSRIRQLDLSDHIRPTTGLLVGFSDDPGPVRLATRTSGRIAYEPLDPERPRTVYRFLIPIKPLEESEP